MFCGVLVAIGFILHLITGEIIWSYFAFPLNLLMLGLYILVLLVLFFLRFRLSFVRWTMSYYAAIPALMWVVLFTLLMGVIEQFPASRVGGAALNRMLSFWPFVLLYLWMTTIVGMVSLKHLVAFRLSRVPFLLNHLGLFLCLVTVSLGSADIQRLRMTVRVGQEEWRAVDAVGTVHGLPFSIRLKKFLIDEYPPKLMLVDNRSGQALPHGAPVYLMLEEGTDSANLLDWRICVREQFPLAILQNIRDTVRYVPGSDAGATYAVRVEAVCAVSGLRRCGWVSCGSFLFPYHALRLDSACSLIMLDREPRCYTSDVVIYMHGGEQRKAKIEVNQPVQAAGWTIYQLGYDETKGRWSDISVFELVSDPWLPAVYVGIFMLMSGTICLFFTVRRR